MRHGRHVVEASEKHCSGTHQRNHAIHALNACNIR
jgi:hypothetical protein